MGDKEGKLVKLGATLIRGVEVRWSNLYVLYEGPVKYLESEKRLQVGGYKVLNNPVNAVASANISHKTLDTTIAVEEPICV